MGYSLADLARLFGMTAQGIGYAVRRGERIAKEQNYRLIDLVSYLMMDVPHTHDPDIRIWHEMPASAVAQFVFFPLTFR